jgi:hypothetical protein
MSVLMSLLQIIWTLSLWRLQLISTTHQRCINLPKNLGATSKF